ncbi:hypothetical protein BG011_003516 [Mortierella polycephala]|uniref:CCHC-type domain-containing protein n=1 Tax=Mortierella polycephala TaxID=41804 RepID=A0A9P6U3K3_9FUNG|nr:hypothetical protein BG011_003516 [Mortierella polycephala]
MNNGSFIHAVPGSTNTSPPEHSGPVIPSCSAEVVAGQPLQGEDIGMGYVSRSAPPVSTRTSLQLPPTQQSTFKTVKADATVVERIANARLILELHENRREHLLLMRLQIAEDALNLENMCTTPEELKKVHAYEMERLMYTQAELSTTDRRIAHVVATIQRLEVPHLATAVTATFDPTPSTWNSVGNHALTANGVPFDDNIPRFGSQKAGIGQPFKVIESPLAFLGRFHSYCSKTMGVDFESNCHRMLIMAVLEDNPRMQLHQKLHQIPAGEMSWEKCEEHFIEIVPTRAQREKELNRVIKGGRRRGESYLRYARRLMHFIRIFKVDVHDKEFLEAIFNTVPSGIVSHIETRLIARNPNDALLDSHTRFCEELEKFHGPDDALDTASGTNVSEEDTSYSRKRSHSSHTHNRRPYGEHGDDQETNRKAFRYNCKKCGDNNTHATEKCMICDNCQKRGHLAAACRSLKRA